MRLGILLMMVFLLPLRALAADCNAAAEPKVDWQRCFLDGRDLAGHDLTGARLRETSFSRAKLDKAVLVGADAYRARFVSATLKGAQADKGVFVEAEFTKADLEGASFKGADLSRAKLYRANLRGADLTGAKMTAADLFNADLSGARWLDGKHICAEGSLGRCN